MDPSSICSSCFVYIRSSFGFGWGFLYVLGCCWNFFITEEMLLMVNCSIHIFLELVSVLTLHGFFSWVVLVITDRLICYNGNNSELFPYMCVCTFVQTPLPPPSPSDFVFVFYACWPICNTHGLVFHDWIRFCCAPGMYDSWVWLEIECNDIEEINTCFSRVYIYF